MESESRHGWTSRRSDLGNTLGRSEIESKVVGLAEYGGAIDGTELNRSLPALWAISDARNVGRLFGASRHP
jgi:hypothetical protein